MLSSERFDRDRFLRLYLKGLNDKEIARRFGVKKNCVFRWRQDMGLSSNYRSVLMPSRVEKEIIKVLKKAGRIGFDTSQITKKLPFDYSAGKVRDFLLGIVEKYEEAKIMNKESSSPNKYTWIEKESP